MPASQQTNSILDAQTDALKATGAERVFADKISGSLRKRPQLDQLLDQLRSGDVIVVTKYDRLARSLRDLLDIVEAIQERGGGFRSLAEDIDTTTPAGRLIFHVFASIAQFERERISERTREGLTFQQIADELGVAASTVTLVCQGRRRSNRISAAIAGKLRMSQCEVWPKTKLEDNDATR